LTLLKHAVLAFCLFCVSIFCQSVFFSPSGDLVLTIFDPFTKYTEMNDQEVTVFKAPRSRAIIQIASFETPKNLTLEDFVQIAAPSGENIENKASFFFDYNSMKLHYRRFTMKSDNSRLEFLQLYCLSDSAGYILSYFAPEEEFFKYMVTAYLSFASLKKGETREHQETLRSEKGYSIDIVSPFKVTSHESESPSFVAHYGQNHLGYIQILDEALNKDISVQQYAALMEKNGLKQLNGYACHEQGGLILKGHEYSWRFFHFNSAGDTYSCLQAYSVFGKHGYVVSYLARVEDFDLFDFPAVLMLFSFKPLL